ncbi:pyridoxal phosphate-dependent aminotransferase [Pseudonocardia adelaidensis]
MDRNEMPFPPEGEVVRAASAALLTSNRYPSWDAAGLRSLLAESFAVSPDWVAVGSGSISVIQQAMIAAGPGELLLPWPTFEGIPMLASALRMDLRRTGLRPDGSCDIAEMTAQITPATRMVVVCTPNTPTGGIVRHDELAEFVAGVPRDVLVLVDEAYVEFVTAPDVARSLDLVRAHPNVLMTRTFSKAYGLAGFRVGYGIAQPALAGPIRAAGIPFTLSAAAEAAAMRALRSRAVMEARVRSINAERLRLTTALRALGLEVADGHGNFVWLAHPGDSDAIAGELAASAVLVKAYSGHGIRISVGTGADTARLLSVWPTRSTKLQRAS